MRTKLSIIILMIAALAFTAGSAFAGEYKEGVDSFKFGAYTIPAYDGDPSEVIHSNVPVFNSSELSKEVSLSYGSLDSLGRCTPAFARLNKSLMPTWPRGSISSIKPSGWIQAKYDIVPSGWLYNRCHLVGWQLTGADETSLSKNELAKNLITGTRFLNVGDGNTGMVGYENAVASFVRKNSSNYVAYKVSPVFQGNNLVASGVLMEAQSVGTNDIKFCTFCYNVQPGIAIDYATGKSMLSSAVPENKDIGSCNFSVKKMVYSGKRLFPKVMVKDGDITLKEGVSYKTTYKGNVYPGKAAVTIAGIGSYKGTKTLYFIISPAKGKIQKAFAKRKAIRITAKNSPKVSGYQFSYKTGKAKWKTVTSRTKTKTIKRLKSKRVYKIKTRSYKTIDKKKVYGSWSAVKNVRTK